jgi:hypothetical protein
MSASSLSVACKLFVCSSLALVVGALGCEDIPKKDYEDFKSRAESLRKPPPMLSERSDLFDITGMWLLNARINQVINLGLRVSFHTPDDEPWPSDERGLKPTTLIALIWLDRHDPLVDPPIFEVETEISEDGRFDVRADPLMIDLNGLAISANVLLSIQTLTADALCGSASGSATMPLPLEIDDEKSTFYAQRDDDLTLTLDELPARCPEQEGVAGGTEGGAEGGAEMSEGGAGGAEG